MILRNEEYDTELDIDVVDNVVDRVFVIRGNYCHQMASWESPAINPLNMNKDEAIQMLQSEGFEQMGDPDPY